MTGPEDLDALAKDAAQLVTYFGTDPNDYDAEADEYRSVARVGAALPALLVSARRVPELEAENRQLRDQINSDGKVIAQAWRKRDAAEADADATRAAYRTLQDERDYLAERFTGESGRADRAERHQCATRQERDAAVAEVERLRAQVAAVEKQHPKVPIYYISDECTDPKSHEDDWCEGEWMNDLLCPRCEPYGWACGTCGTSSPDDPATYPCPTISALAAVSGGES